ncbi:hypothetical protein B0H14DRAFT_3140316 [Mycena olivaceomarginata]|nr:hypothetical protein B0H14DRAFT_3140316 [Mycena olivaceomarginata]
MTLCACFAAVRQSLPLSWLEWACDIGQPVIGSTDDGCKIAGMRLYGRLARLFCRYRLSNDVDDPRSASFSFQVPAVGSRATVELLVGVVMAAPYLNNRHERMMPSKPVSHPIPSQMPQGFQCSQARCCPSSPLAARSTRGTTTPSWHAVPPWGARPRKWTGYPAAHTPPPSSPRRTSHSAPARWSTAQAAAVRPAPPTELAITAAQPRSSDYAGMASCCWRRLCSRYSLHESDLNQSLI